MHNEGEKYLGWIKANCVEVETPQPGDIVIFRYGHCFSHGGVITGLNPVTLVHSWVGGGWSWKKASTRTASDQAHSQAVFFSFWAQKAGA